MSNKCDHRFMQILITGTMSGYLVCRSCLARIDIPYGFPMVGERSITAPINTKTPPSNKD